MGGAAIALVPVIGTGSYLRIALGSAISAMVYGLFVLILALTRQERELLFTQIAKRLRRGRVPLADEQS